MEANAEEVDLNESFNERLANALDGAEQKGADEKMEDDGANEDVDMAGKCYLVSLTPSCFVMCASHPVIIDDEPGVQINTDTKVPESMAEPLSDKTNNEMVQ